MALTRGQDFRGTGSWPLLSRPKGYPMQRNPHSVSALWLFLLSCMARRTPYRSRMVGPFIFLAIDRCPVPDPIHSFPAC
jgi:hypothetical protein